MPPKYFVVIDRVCVDERLSSNGGDYSFWRSFWPVDGGYEVHHRTSADFTFCEVCGNFSDCEDRHDGYLVVGTLPDGAEPRW